MKLAEPDNVVNCPCLNEPALHYIVMNNLLWREFSESWLECFWQHCLDWTYRNIMEALIECFFFFLFCRVVAKVSISTFTCLCKGIRTYSMYSTLLLFNLYIVISVFFLKINDHSNKSSVKCLLIDDYWINEAWLFTNVTVSFNYLGWICVSELNKKHTKQKQTTHTQTQECFALTAVLSTKNNMRSAVG